MRRCSGRMSRGAGLRFRKRGPCLLRICSTESQLGFLLVGLQWHSIEIPMLHSKLCMHICRRLFRRLIHVSFHFIQSLIHSFIQSFIQSFFQSLIHSFIHSFIQSFFLMRYVFGEED
jgi:hypothetical protein